MFVLAVFVPSLVLAWLAVRSLRDQQFALERQRALLYQGVADAVAKDIVGYITDRQREFGLQVEALLGDNKPLDLANSFDDQLRKSWPLAEVGFTVSLDGSCYSPSLFGGPEARKFRLDNERFLCNRESVEVYWDSPKGTINLSQLDAKTSQSGSATKNAQQPAANENSYANSSARSPKDQKQTRNVEPQQAQKLTVTGNYSKIASSEAEFRQLIGDSTEGTVARFLQNKLNLMFWYRSPRDPQLVFGALLNLPKLVGGLGGSVKVEPASLNGEICVALLTDSAAPAVLSNPDFRTNWKRPFVATEIGEVLPHWEIGAYLLDPATLARSAQTLKLTLGLLIAVLVLAIGVGGWLIVGDLKRQLTLARQKTDFVSNVSHELKTPLTSIRMFSELLADERVTDKAKQRSYLNIITTERSEERRVGKDG